jgi:hypothetical protein
MSAPALLAPTIVLDPDDVETLVLLADAKGRTTDDLVADVPAWVRPRRRSSSSRGEAPLALPLHEDLARRQGRTSLRRRQGGDGMT